MGPLASPKQAQRPAAGARESENARTPSPDATPARASPPNDPGIEALAYELIGDPGPSLFDMWLRHEPERQPTSAEDAVEPAQDSLTVRVELRDPREVSVRAALYHAEDSSATPRQTSASSRQFDASNRGGLKELEFSAFFEPGEKPRRGGIYEAIIRTFDASGGPVREVKLRWTVP